MGDLTTKDTPGFRMGIQKGDFLVAVKGVDVVASCQSPEEIVRLFGFRPVNCVFVRRQAGLVTYTCLPFLCPLMDLHGVLIRW